jgi:WhiB family redox-sensing transcriptional regulator
LRLTPKTEDWRADAACFQEDPNIFFPLKTTYQSVQAAFAFCKTCPVKIDCLHLSVVYGYEGIWGHSTFGQRLHVLKEHFNNDNTNFTIQDAKRMYAEINNVSVKIRPNRRRKKES